MLKKMLGAARRSIIKHVRKVSGSLWRPYLPMRALPFLGGADDVILDVCMSSPMYLMFR